MDNLKNLKSFYIGQKVVCIIPNEGIGKCWTHEKTKSTGPNHKDIVTVRGYGPGPEHFLILIQYPPNEGYNPIYFKPVSEVFPLISYSKVLEEIPVSAN